MQRRVKLPTSSLVWCRGNLGTVCSTQVPTYLESRRRLFAAGTHVHLPRYLLYVFLRWTEMMVWCGVVWVSMYVFGWWIWRTCCPPKNARRRKFTPYVSHRKRGAWNWWGSTLYDAWILYLICILIIYYGINCTFFYAGNCTLIILTVLQLGKLYLICTRDFVAMTNYTFFIPN